MNGCLTRGRAHLIGAVGIFLTALALAGSPVRAADGAFGATSTGSINLDLQVNEIVMLTGLNDVNMGTWTGAGNMTSFEFACTFSSTTQYRVTATSANGAGQWHRLSNGSGTFLRYLVHWRDSNNFQRRLRHSQESVQFFTDATAITCNGATNTRIRIRVRSQWLAAAPAGTYSDTLTLLVRPD